ncbi:biotin/lipoyl-containing protein, partial [Brevibacterium aurantiacum]
SSLTRVNIEIDGKLSSLGLPSALLAALGTAGNGPAGTDDGGAGGTGSDGGAAETGGVSAPVPGNLVDYLIADGAEVAEGDDVAVLSAMKMETRVQAPSAGRLKQLSKVGDMVAVGEVFARIE